VTTTVFAQPPPSVPVASTSQKGSVLKWPLIDIQDDDATDTIIHISNDNTIGVQVKCYYLNEKKGRRDFSFFLTPKQTATWSVSNHNGTLAVANFPDNGSFSGGRANVGELVCFAVNGATQIKFNHLSGMANIVSFSDGDAAQPHQAFTYNAYAFKARADVAEGAPVGTAGTILLNGEDYDACPAYLITEFSPSGATLHSRQDLTSLDSNLAVASCKEDLRQDFQVHITKLAFTVWNALETEFTGAYICSDTTREFGLDPQDAPPDLVAAENFTFGVLDTTDARFEVRGVQSTQCAGSESTGLLGVLRTSLAIAPDVTESAEVGTTLRGAGSDTTGFILWDAPPDIITPEIMP